MSDALPLRDSLRFGTMIGLSDREQAIRTIESISRWGFEIVWTGDHVAFTGPINDPLIQLTYLSALNPKLIFGTSVYVISAPQYAEHVLRKNWQNYVKGRAIKRVALLLGNGLMVSEGEFWKSQRRIMQPAFRQQAIESLIGVGGTGTRMSTATHLS